MNPFKSISKTIFFKVKKNQKGVFLTLFLFCFLPLNANLFKKSLCNPKRISVVAEYLLKKINTCTTDFDRYKYNRQAVKLFPGQNLLVGAKDGLLFATDVEYRKLFFTKLDYGLVGQIKELRYFYYGDYESLSHDYLFLVKRINTIYGQHRDKLINGKRVETIWKWKNYKFVFIFDEERVQQGGVIYFSVFKDNEDIYTSKGFSSTESLETNSISSVEVKSKEQAPEIILKKPIASPKETPLTQEEIPVAIEKEEVFKKEAIKRNKAKPIASYPEGTLFRVSKTTSLRSESIDDGEILARVRPDDTFTILDADSNYYWTWIDFKDKVGWVKTSLIIPANN